MPDAALHVALVTNAYVPLAVVTPVDNVATCPLIVMLQPLVFAGMLPEIAPDAETVPVRELVDPEIAEVVPDRTPFDIVNETVPVRLEPLDWPPLQFPE